VVSGFAMLIGSVAGGFIAQVTNLGVPYVIRSVILGLTMITAFIWMKDLGFTPDRSKGALLEIRRVLRESIDSGWRNPPVRWLMLAAFCAGGVDIFAFYALQPYLLQLYGDPGAFGIAGLAAAIVAGTQMVAGLIVPRLHGLFGRRTHALIATTLIAGACLAGLGRTSSFAVAIGCLIVWGLTFSIRMPIRQAYLNGIIPTQQRATVLSFDSLMASGGAAIAQPALGRVADVSGYPLAYLVSAGLQLTALPFLVMARRERASSDPFDATGVTHRPSAR
jgi:MFS family permease